MVVCPCRSRCMHLKQRLVLVLDLALDTTLAGCVLCTNSNLLLRMLLT